MAIESRGERVGVRVQRGMGPEAGKPRYTAQELMVSVAARQIRDGDLVFVGMHNISQYWWCGMYAVLKSRANELEFFAAYLGDRIGYALMLGIIDRLPRKQDELLKIAQSLTLKQASKLLASKTLLREFTRKSADSVKKLTKPDELDHFERGAAAELERAEDLPTFRWHFPYSRYVLVGCPDGITRDLVYEFKSTNKHYFFSFTKPIALTQADLYGHFFGRKQKRVDIYVRDTDTCERFDGPVDEARVSETLQKFSCADAGQLPHPPAKFKCRNCEYKKECCMCQWPDE